MGFDLKDAASIGIIGAADGPTSILVSQVLNIQTISAPSPWPPTRIWRWCPLYSPLPSSCAPRKKSGASACHTIPRACPRPPVSCSPSCVTVIAGLVAPSSVALVGFLMFGNLIRECGVLDNLSQTAQKELANLITLLLGLTISASMKAEHFVNWQTVDDHGAGPGGLCVRHHRPACMFAKLINLFLPKRRSTPWWAAAGISAFPMSSRVIQKMGLQGRHPEPPADARRWRQCSRSDRFGHRGRRDPGPGARHAAVRKEVLLWICMW